LDLATLPDHLLHRKLTFGQWLRSLCSVRETAWFDWSDRSPFWAMCLSVLGSRWSGRFNTWRARRSDLAQPPASSGVARVQPRREQIASPTRMPSPKRSQNC
jgi:hypothetical protein